MLPSAQRKASALAPMHFGAQSRGLRAPCERFASWVAPGTRITRFRLAAGLGRMGLDTQRVSNKVSKITSRHLVLLDRACPGTRVGAWIAEKLECGPQRVIQLSIAQDADRPSSIIRFRMLQAISASVFCALECRARSRFPMIDLYLKKAFSTVPWRW